MAEDFLGTGWQFPVVTDADGRIELSSGERTIEESIRIILGTAKGERVMRPEFGCGIHEFTFAAVDATKRTRIETTVREALREWEPRIEVESVTASDEELATGKLLVHIEYRVRRTNEERNLVYPFYIRGGQRVE